MKVIAANHKVWTTNLGDLVSSPCIYFDYDARHVNIRKPLPLADAYIFGGGAMFPPWWIGGACPESGLGLFGVSGIKVAWGLGQTNRANKKTLGSVPADFALFGSRDVGQKGAEWVPCASCMSPLFDIEYEVEHEFVAYLNLYPDKTVVRPESEVVELPMMYNRGNFEDAVEFIASGSVCVTNSYHGAYWATLLGRAAIIVSPYSSKFYCFKHQPAVVEFLENWREAKIVTFPEALSECRAANVAFDNKVRSALC